MTKKLWLGLVEHESTPGTVPVLIASAAEPEDDEIIGRCVMDGVRAEQLTVEGLFDLSWALNKDQNNARALMEYLGGPVHPDSPPPAPIAWRSAIGA